MDRKTGGKRGKPQYFDKRRKPEDEWASKASTTTNTGRVKKKYGSKYDSNEYDYQYIHKDRRQYGRDELLKVAGKATIKSALLKDLVYKFDLVFSEELRKPVGDTDDGKGERFIESANDNEGRDRRDDMDYQEKPQHRKKEFVRFDDLEDEPGNFDKVDSYLEKKYKQSRYDDEDELPAWATEDYEGEVPQWDTVDTKEVLKQTENLDNWAKSNMKMLDKQQIKNNLNDLGDDGIQIPKEERDYYAYDAKKHKYNFFDEYEEEDEDGDQYQKKKRSSGSADKDEDINSLWKKMKQEEEDEQDTYNDEAFASEVITADYYLEELREKAGALGQKVSSPHEGVHPSSFTNPMYTNSGSQRYPQNQPAQFAASNLGKIMNPFAGISGTPNQMMASQIGAQRQGTSMPVPMQSHPSPQQVQYQKQTSGSRSHPAEDIDLIEGPPPSVIKKEEEFDEKKEKAKKEFQEKYIAMDKALNQIVYDALNSKRRGAIHHHSSNGISQTSVEKYCENNYKIFSFLMQGDIFSKVWSYKDKLGNVQGPYMSFDMDIWNGEGVYFAKNLAISANKKDYLPLHMYLDRDSQVIDLMQEVTEKVEKGLEPTTPPVNMKMVYNGNQMNMMQQMIQSGQIPMMSPGKQMGSPTGPHPHHMANSKGMVRRGGPGPQFYQSGHTPVVDPRAKQSIPNSPVYSSPQQTRPISNEVPNSNVDQMMQLLSMHTPTHITPDAPVVQTKAAATLPNDPAIQKVSTYPPTPEPVRKAAPVASKPSKKFADDDFPSLSTVLKK